MEISNKHVMLKENVVTRSLIDKQIKWEREKKSGVKCTKMLV